LVDHSSDVSGKRQFWDELQPVFENDEDYADASAKRPAVRYRSVFFWEDEFKLYRKRNAKRWFELHNADFGLRFVRATLSSHER
jgi:hypothetical protein